MKYCIGILLLVLATGCSTVSIPPGIESEISVTPSAGPNPVSTIQADAPTSINMAPAGWISFDSKQDGVWGIYLKKADGSGKAQPLTVHQKGDNWSAWSPDGQTIAFSSFRESTESINTSSIYIINMDGTGFRKVTDSGAKDSMPAWSPNGKEIAFASDRDAGNTDIYVVKVDGIGLKRLTDDPAGDIWPSWSPDGKRIAFVSNRSGNWQVHTMNADGTNVIQLTDTSVNGNSAWSPDGRQIAFISGRDGNSEIYVMDIDGGNIRRLTNDPGRDDYPAWSPDGRYITFVSDRAGSLDVYVMNVDGSDVKRVTDEPTDEYPPKWSPANVTISTEPGFGTPYCLRDTDNDGIGDTSTNEFPQSDQAFYISFPYNNMHENLKWSAVLVSENTESFVYSPISYSATWNNEESGVMTLRFRNMTNFEITGPIHGAGIGPMPPGSMKLQLFIEDKLMQETECEVTPSEFTYSK